MITIYDVTKWLESAFTFGASKYTSPTLSSKDKKVFCCQRGTQGQEEHPGVFRVLPIDLYIHWNEDEEETEEKANEVYDALFRKQEFTINDIDVSFINIKTNEPTAMGKDGAGIYNYLISFDLVI